MVDRTAPEAGHAQAAPLAWTAGDTASAGTGSARRGLAAGWEAVRRILRRDRRREALSDDAVGAIAADAGLDPAWYLSRYPDVSSSGFDPRRHYAEHGRAETRFANADAEILSRAVDVDPHWYLARYSDVRRANFDARRHYGTHGYAEENRFPNAAAEAAAAAAAAVDPRWYLARYPDVRESGCDPRQHYARHGRAEGRFPNPSQEPREAWEGRFDPVWYAIRNADVAATGLDPLEHFRTIGMFEERAANPGEEHRDAWNGVFDADWYVERYPDVREAGLDPLDHFIRVGIVERRRPNAAAVPTSTPVTQAEIEELKTGPLGGEVVVFATHSADGLIEPHVAPLVAAFKEAGIDCILVAMCDTARLVVPPAAGEAVDVVYRRSNSGFDVAAWAHVLRLRPELFGADIIYLANDSVFGPVGRDAFAGIIGRIRATEADIVGLTDTSERGWHLQSYFLAMKRGALASPALRGFMLDVVALAHEDEVVNEYETQLTRRMMAAGLRCESLFPTPGLRNASLFKWKELLDAGCPFIRVAAVRGMAKGSNPIGWRELASARGFDTAPADRTLAGMAARTSVLPLDLKSMKFNHRHAARAELHAFFATTNTIELPAHPEPVISVLMVVYNEAELTYRCLQSMVATIDLPAEFIIVDNASTDDTRHLLGRVRNALIVRNVEDLHFLRAANQAAARARGRAVLFLNNDIRLEPAAVRYGLDTLDSADDIAVVGGKLILMDGRLQEAGSIIWRDGTCVGFGRGQPPDGYPYDFRREVDFCSGAYMMMRRDVFERLNRFDPVYAPAYYEETDLCMRVRAAGYRVMFDPRIVVHHYEFASMAFAGEPSSLMQRNFATFVGRHAHALAEHHPAKDTPLHLASTHRGRRTRLLLIENLMPLVSYGAGFPRTSRIVSCLDRLGFFVTYYPTHQDSIAPEERLAHCPVDVEFVLGHDRPPLLQFIESRAGHYDGIIICRFNNIELIREHFLSDPYCYGNATLVYDAEAVCAPRDARRDAIHGEDALPGVRRIGLKEELELPDIAALTIVVNERDASYFRDVGRANVRVLGYSIAATPTARGFEERRDFLLVGRLDHDVTPNADSLIWFIDEVMPRLDALIGTDYRLIVAGQTGSARLASVTDERISMLGRVDDVTACYDRARVFIAPTRYAAGVPLKVYEAAAHGVPTVITPILAGQLGWRHGEAALVAEEPDTFAEACRRLYTDAALWNAVREAALGEVRRTCGGAEFDARLSEALGSVGLRA